MSNNKLWIVGKITNVLNDGWDFIGVFKNEELAKKAILSAFDYANKEFHNDDKNSYFIAPASLNEIFLCPNGSDWQGGYFPFSI
jgi:hypothetical protein